MQLCLNSPGYTETNSRVLPKDMIEIIEKHTPLRRIGQPLDVAKGVVFLASSDAQFITGVELVVDGGIVYNMPNLFPD